jgi:exopolysaccharide biosynthesis protein
MKGIIGVAYHKNYCFSYQDSFFYPLHVGASLSKENLNYLKDNEGENISSKNKNFCELTGIYWMWKNVKADFYGMMHYRRYLILKNDKWIEKNFNKFIGRSFYINRLINIFFYTDLFQTISSDKLFIQKELKYFSEHLSELMEKNDVILPKKIKLETSVYKHYKKFHIIKHLDLLMEVIKEDYSYLYKYVEKYIKKSRYMYSTNMFIMKKEIFFEYCEFLFDVLFKLESKIMIPNDVYQTRVFGFLSERLMLPFINYLKYEKKIKIKELHVLFCDLN